MKVWPIHCLIVRLHSLLKHPKRLSLSLSPHHIFTSLPYEQLPLNSAEWSFLFLPGSHNLTTHCDIRKSFWKMEFLSRNLAQQSQVTNSTAPAEIEWRLCIPPFLDWKHHRNFTSANMQHAEARQIQGLYVNVKPMCSHWAASFKQKICSWYLNI